MERWCKPISNNPLLLIPAQKIYGRALFEDLIEIWQKLGDGLANICFRHVNLKCVDRVRQSLNAIHPSRKRNKDQLLTKLLGQNYLDKITWAKLLGQNYSDKITWTKLLGQNYSNKSSKNQ